jgi:hypothetical protein
MSNAHTPHTLRVNGVEIKKVRIVWSRSNERAARKVIVVDSVIGEFGIDDEFEIELRENNSGLPASDSDGWRRVSIEELLLTLCPGENSSQRPAEDLHASPSFDGSDVLDGKLFSCNYGDEFVDDPEDGAPTSEEWGWAIRRVSKALFARGILYYVRSSYFPPRQPRRDAFIDVVVDDPELAADWVCKNRFTPDPENALQVFSPHTKIKVKFARGNLR